MFETKTALNGNVVLTVLDSHGMTVFCETVKATDAEEIGERAVATAR